MQKTLDLSIKLLETGTLEGGYSAAKLYESYMDNQSWDRFVNDMKQNYSEAFQEYGAGSGGELKPKGNYPPKMASYGSSSRMIFNLCKDIPEFHFEYKLPTRVGGIANLDGYIENQDIQIYIEAKCREPYGVKPHLIERKYADLYRFINDDSVSNLSIDMENINDKMKVRFHVGDDTISCFDIKQMICHLLGIANELLNNPTEKNILFLYLCYSPKLIEIIDSKKSYTILNTYEKMCLECNSIAFKGLFGSIVKYLSQELKVGVATAKQVDMITSNFDFALCDQANYKKYLF